MTVATTNQSGDSDWLDTTLPLSAPFSFLVLVILVRKSITTELFFDILGILFIVKLIEVYLLKIDLIGRCFCVWDVCQSDTPSIFI